MTDPLNTPTQAPLSWRQKLLSVKFWLRQCRDLLLIGLVLFAVSSYLQREMITGQAPELFASDIYGNPLELRPGSGPTLIYFWGTWCPVCRVTSPMVDDISQDHRVISIAVASGTDIQIQAYMAEYDYHFPVINDGSGLNTIWGAMTMPAIYVVDNRGEIRFITSGVTSAWGMRLRLWLAGTIN